ncbi:MAG: hypothetical protein ACK4N5_27515, partial [Myxococcales bacterium]
MSTPKPPPGPVSQAVRTLHLAIALGVAAFIASSAFAVRLRMSLTAVADALPDWLLLPADLFTLHFGALVIAPLIAYAAGHLLTVRPVVIGVGMTFARTALVLAIEYVTGALEYRETLPALLEHLAVFVISSALCTLAF